MPLARFVATKGSVALDGTSLTVNSVDGTRDQLRRRRAYCVKLVAATLFAGAYSPPPALNVQ